MSSEAEMMSTHFALSEILGSQRVAPLVKNIRSCATSDAALGSLAPVRA